MPSTVTGENAQLLGRILGADMNSTGDQPIPISASKYVIRKVVVTNPSISLTTAVGGFYTAAAKGGTAIIASSQVYAALTAAAKFLDVTLAAILGTDVRTEAILYFALTVAQGAPATADIFIFGDVLP